MDAPRLSRSAARAVLFEFFQRQLSGRQQAAVRHAFVSLEQLHPALAAVLRQAHDGGDRTTVNWRLEQRAIDELRDVLGWHHVTRNGVARKAA